MTQRERQASGGSSATVATPVVRTSGSPPPPRAGLASQADLAHAALWEEVYQTASPAQQSELLALAGRQGLLYAHQLPASGNGARPQTPADNIGNRQRLTRLLNGHLEHLEPVRGQPVD